MAVSLKSGWPNCSLGESVFGYSAFHNGLVCLCVHIFNEPGTEELVEIVQDLAVVFYCAVIGLAKYLMDMHRDYLLIVKGEQKV
jgi:hypothetical protein